MGKRLAILILGMAVGLGAGAAPASEPIRIGWTAWPDAEFVTRLTARIIEERMHREVRLVQTDIAPQYRGLAQGAIDMMLMAWLPDTHDAYIKQARGDVFSLGILYGYARLGWAVPDYVPRSQVGSMADLSKPEVRGRLGGTIVGIERGTGLAEASEKAMEVYGLDDYRLRLSSGADMTAALDRAIERDEWIVVTGWSPHWKFSAYDLRYLEDPKGVLGRYERVHAMAHKGFYQANPEVALMVSRMFIPIDQLQAAMYDARQTSYEEAVERFIDNNREMVDYWVTGKLEGNAE